MKSWIRKGKKMRTSTWKMARIRKEKCSRTKIKNKKKHKDKDYIKHNKEGNIGASFRTTLEWV